MEKQNESSLQKTLIDNFQSMSKLSVNTMQPLFKNMVETASNLNNSILEGKIPSLDLSSFQINKKSNCCPPVTECPPQCIASISREARSDERIIVPFLIKNTCSTQKTYRVGVRELKNLDGQLAPNQLFLNKTAVTLAPGARENILMSLDLSNFSNGSTYEAEIVIREKEINQNICFTLYVNDHTPMTVSPYNENQYKQKWLNWHSHFYCDPPKYRDGINTDFTHNN